MDQTEQEMREQSIQMLGDFEFLDETDQAALLGGLLMGLNLTEYIAEYTGQVAVGQLQNWGSDVAGVGVKMLQHHDPTRLTPLQAATYRLIRATIRMVSAAEEMGIMIILSELDGVVTEPEATNGE